MKKTLFIKYIIAYTLIIVTFGILTSVLSLNIIKKSYYKTYENNLLNIASVMKNEVKRILLSKNDFSKIQSYVTETSIILNKRITIISPDGEVIADSHKNPQQMENHINRPEVIKALRENKGTSIRFSNTIKKGMLYVAIPIKNHSNIVAILRLSIYTDVIDNLVKNIRFTIIMIFIIVFAIGFFVIWFITRSISKPISELVQASSDIASGNFGRQVMVKSDGEILELANIFNYMSKKIHDSLTDLNQRHEELLHIINSIRSGIMVLDKKGKIILFNPSMEKILGKFNIKMRYFWEIVEDNKLLDTIKDALTNKAFTKIELKLNNNYYKVSISPINFPEEYIMVFHNITELKVLQEIKKDFVMNVSHELKTPLTAIKGYAETIEGLKGENAEYLEIIKRHTDRLINIVNDLLTLSELEDREFNYSSYEEINLCLLTENIVNLFNTKIKDKPIEINLKCNKKIITMKADNIQIEQLLINLIDNAVKYTEEGSIDIDISDEKDAIKIVVSDTGIGIPSKHINRIFERFYTVDKSHSRKLGGTGLGLSIVKHIVNIYKGTISVKSTPRKGTSFLISIPK